MNRTSIINHLIAKHHYKSYLEIGVQNGINFHNIYCPKKVGVDPDEASAATIKMTSDDFFAGNKDNYDLIFIDGLHIHYQVNNDINNALAYLNPNGIIVCHDMLPTTEYMQVDYNTGGEWTGNCWRAFLDHRQCNYLEMRTVNADYGIGLIRYGKQEPLIIPESELNYPNFEKNKQEWMNIITVQQFLELY